MTQAPTSPIPAAWSGERLGVGTDDLLHVHALVSSIIAPKYAANIVRGNYASQVRLRRLDLRGRFCSPASDDGGTISPFSPAPSSHLPQGGFAISLALKDMGHVRTLARDVSCPAPIADLVFNGILSARAQHGQDLDWSGIVLPVRQAAGLGPIGEAAGVVQEGK